MPQTVLQLVLRGAPCQVVADRRQGTLAVVGMEPRFPLLVAVADLVVLVAELLLPAGREVDLVGREVPVPEAVARAPDRHLEALAAAAEHLLGPAPLGDVVADEVEDRAEQGEVEEDQHDVDPHRVAHAAARRVDLGVEPPALLDPHLLEDVADLPHLRLGRARHGDRGRVGALGPEQLDRPAQPLESRRDEIPQPGDAIALVRAVGGEGPEGAEVLGEPVGRGLVGVEERLVAGDQVAALAGLGVGDQRADRLDLGHHPEGVRDAVAVVDGLSRRVVRQGGDEHQDGQRRAEPDDHLNLDRPSHGPRPPRAAQRARRRGPTRRDGPRRFEEAPAPAQGQTIASRRPSQDEGGTGLSDQKRSKRCAASASGGGSGRPSATHARAQAIRAS